MENTEQTGIAAGAAVTPVASPAKTIAFEISGRRFVFRKPSRGDIGDAIRLFVLKLSSASRELLDIVDGESFLWESRFEIGFCPRANGELGESVPSDWLEIERDHNGKEVGRKISFANVDPNEFDAVIQHLETQVFAQIRTLYRGPAVRDQQPPALPRDPIPTAC